MGGFVHGVWQDLRDKRLWPVAAVLLVALIAVPVVLLKGGSDESGSAPPAAVASPEAAGLPTASLAEQRSSENSDLGVFDPKDPFRPPGGFRAAAGSGSGVAGGAPVPTPSGVPSAAAAAGGGATADTSGGSTPSGSSGSDSTTAPSSGGTTTARKTYTYVIDIRFGERGEVRSRKGVRRLALLPSSRNPRLVFLGVSDDRRNAIFLVESGLTQEGEGKCKPSRRFCSFLYLRTADSRDDHYFSTEGGKQYVLHLSRIRRVEVKPKAKPSRRAPRSSRADVGPGALFESPVFVDELR